MTSQICGERVAITGMAWITALGDEIEPVWNALVAGRSALPDPCATPLCHPPRDAAGPRMQAWAATAVRRALAIARVSCEDARVRVVAGTDAEADTATGSLSAWLNGVAETLRLAHPAIAVATACAAGSDAILVGTELIRAGWTDICVCGGADAVTPGRAIGHATLGTASRTTLRAFDRRHDGTVFGGGAGFLVLESRASAAARGARVYGFIRGVGSANDAATLTAPHPDGLGVKLAVQRALGDAGATPSDVGVIKAHGSGTPTNDRAEAAALQAMFTGSSRPVVFAIKGALTHTLGASGAIEAIALLQALRTGCVPPIAGLETPDAIWSLPLALGQATAVQPGLGLGVALGFGGCASCLVLQVA